MALMLCSHLFEKFYYNYDIESIDVIASRNQKKRKLNQGKFKKKNKNNNKKVITIGNEYKLKLKMLYFINIK
jgi:hypothetical protein